MRQLEWLKQRLQEMAPDLELREQEPMSAHTSFKIGGPAALMALPKSEAEAAAAVRAAAEAGVQPLFIGNGSNLLVSDAGIDGFVIKAAGGLAQYKQEGNRITAGSGILLARLAQIAQKNGLTGLEFAHGIPGSLGGAITMNAGAYGGELAQVVRSVTCLNSRGETEVLTDCGFAYRHSCFETGERMILSACLELSPGDPAEIQAQMARLMEQRRSKQPLEWPSGGSAFKRPEGHFAAALIDQCGLKGRTVGGAQVSEKHAGFLINRGGATCADVVALMEQVQDEVLRQTGITLEPELKRIGR